MIMNTKPDIHKKKLDTQQYINSCNKVQFSFFSQSEYSYKLQGAMK